nr:PREDICTED: uncharacterized protein LOC105669264 [Linepithema humile]
MRQYEELGHMTKVDPADPNAECTSYLPHHGVMRASGASAKIRVVFNGSTTIPSGTSLNQHLLVGQNLLPPLANVLLRWRLHRYVLATDVEKMYRQILVHPEDRDLQRIIWRDDEQGNMGDFRLNTVTYGLACAPFLAMRTLRQLAEDEAGQYPLGASALRCDVYMDDVLSGAATLDEARDLQRQLTGLCTAGGFPLQKWSANKPSLLADVPAEHRMQREQRDWRPHESHSTLGLQWHPSSDEFSFATRRLTVGTITKRSVLSLIAKLFDPLGWLAPTVVIAKIEFQSTWLQGLDWDTPLDEEFSRQWADFQAELPLLEGLRVPRWVTSCDPGARVEIHGFADASERAYAAVVYLRTAIGESWHTSIIAAKSKVAPTKQISLPRLELCAAALLMRLASGLQATLELACQDPSPSVVGFHRRSRLDSKAPVSQTHAARPGPPPSKEPEELLRFSSLQRLLRVTAWHRRWLRSRPTTETITAPKADSNRLGDTLSVAEINAAQTAWILRVQAEKYKAELDIIKQSRILAKSNTLTRLSPFLDPQGILRVGGRIKHAIFAYDERHLIIFPGDSHLTRLIVEASHRSLHDGVQMTLGLVRQRYWVPRGRSLVKQLILRCVTCVRWRAAVPQQLMGDLPRLRVTPARPFLNTGVDYAGPIQLRTSKGRGRQAYKAFIAVFVCLSTRAVHLEVVSDYTADAFLAALRRFVSRRELCRTIHNDCGTNFVGADAQLRALFAASSPERRRIVGQLTADQI